MRRPLPALVCATHNRGKLRELRALISSTSLASQIIDAAALDIDGGLSMSVMNHMPGRKWS